MESEGAESRGAEPQGAASSGVPASASPSLSPRPETLSPQQLREWLVRRARLWSGATRAGGTGDTGAGGAAVTAGAGGTRGTVAAGPGGARTRGTGAAGTGGVGGAGAGDPTEPGAAGAGGIGAGGAGARGARAGGTDAGGVGAGGAGAVDPGGTVRPRPYFIPLLQQDLGVPSCSCCTYVYAVPPPGPNIVDGMWIFRVKQPPGSPPAFKARYVARGFSQRQGRDYELHSLDFSTSFLQGSLHEEIWLRRPPGFNGSLPDGTQWSLRRPVYGLRQAPREWHDCHSHNRPKCA
ncbi:unnamed protein product [Closterium sp. NIES-53]